jgi:hypothetical protein
MSEAARNAFKFFHVPLPPPNTPAPQGAITTIERLTETPLPPKKDLGQV